MPTVAVISLKDLQGNSKRDERKDPSLGNVVRNIQNRRKFHRKRRPLTQLAGDVHRGIVVNQYVLHNGKSQAGAAGVS